VNELLNEAVGLAVVMTPIIAILVELVKSAHINKQFLPLISIVLGIAMGVVFSYAMSADVFLYGLAGLLSGASASGLYDVTKSVLKGGKSDE